MVQDACLRRLLSFERRTEFVRMANQNSAHPYGAVFQKFSNYLKRLQNIGWHDYCPKIAEQYR